jgi:hypothetical protein
VGSRIEVSAAQEAVVAEHIEEVGSGKWQGYKAAEASAGTSAGTAVEVGIEAQEEMEGIAVGIEEAQFADWPGMYHQAQAVGEVAAETVGPEAHYPRLAVRC